MKTRSNSVITLINSWFGRFLWPSFLFLTFWHTKDKVPKHVYIDDDERCYQRGILHTCRVSWRNIFNSFWSSFMIIGRDLFRNSTFTGFDWYGLLTTHNIAVITISKICQAGFLHWRSRKSKNLSRMTFIA